MANKKSAMYGAAKLRHNTKQLEKAYGSDILKKYIQSEKLGTFAKKEIRGTLSKSDSVRAATLGDRYLKQQKRRKG